MKDLLLQSTADRIVEPAQVSLSERAVSHPLVWLFGATLFLSSFLMFLLEPMVAKMILPLLGGAPMVWNTCVVFFQMTLLAGYGYAHGATALGPKRHAMAYALLLMASCAVLPFGTRLVTAPAGDANPVAWLLLTLVTFIGLPFFVLSSTASVLQKWFSTTDHPSASDPYFLYAASNLGSLLALLLYPVVVEPTFTLGLQRRLWSWSYLVFVGLALACAMVAWSRRTSHQQDAEIEHAARASSVVTWGMRLKWVGLSFIPSSLMLGVTTYLSTDIAPVPLLWVLPLSLYLLTFVLAFGWRTSGWGAIASRRLPLLVAALLTFMAARFGVPAWLQIPLHLLVFALAAMLCHGKLADERPHRAALTEFYLWIAFGGMLGGLFNTLAAPHLFTGIVEYPLVLVLACLVRGGYTGKIFSDRRAMDVLVPAGVGLLTTALIMLRHRPGVSSWMMLVVLGLPAILVFAQGRHPVRFALSVGAMLLASTIAGSSYGRVLYAERTFFGTYRVSLDESGRFRSLFHGTTLHGIQAIDRSKEHEPLTYYHWTGPFGQAVSRLPEAGKATDVAVIGLGVGSLASYAQPGQRWTFYEIDPAVERIARNADYFTYLRNCGDACQVVIGDARLSLAHAEPGRYGLLVLDAFSSDAIPVHLMTHEALGLYLSKLTPDGILAFHVSNRHLNLGPVLARLATAHGLTAMERRYRVDADQAAGGQTPSEWIMMARDRRQLEPLLQDSQWEPPVASASTPLWTDDFSNILSVLKRGKSTS